MLRKTGSESPAQRLTLVVVLALAGGISFASAASIPRDGLHPLALMAALLPLQLAALLYVFRRP
jgi:hypothetical protein